jgi:hypothetical protein
MRTVNNVKRRQRPQISDGRPRSSNGAACLYQFYKRGIHDEVAANRRAQHILEYWNWRQPADLKT